LKVRNIDLYQPLVRAASICVISLILISYAGKSYAAPHQEARAALVSFLENSQANNVDGMLAAYSDEYQDSRGGHKGVLRGAFNAMIAQGIFTNWSFDITDCEVAIDGNIAAMSPVHLSSPFGNSSYAYKMKRETDGVWRIVNSEEL
jgi:ketosteroid isomerase-like protein